MLIMCVLFVNFVCEGFYESANCVNHKTCNP